MQVGDMPVNVGRNAALSAGFSRYGRRHDYLRHCGSSSAGRALRGAGVIAGSYDVVIARASRSCRGLPMGSSFLPGSMPFGSRRIAL